MNQVALGKIYAKKRVCNRAIVELQKALELSAGSLEAKSQLGYAYVVLGNRQ